jgi:hypothetical protein
MKFTIEAFDEEVEFNLKRGISVNDYVDTVFKAFEKPLTKLLGEFQLDRYYMHGNDTLSDESVMEVAERYIKTGNKDEAVEVLSDVFGDQNIYEALRSIESDSDYEDFLEQVQENGVHLGLKISEINDVIEERIEDDLEDMDESGPEDLIQHEKVLIGYVPGLEGGYVEDIMVQSAGISSDPISIIPDRKFENLLKFLNMSSKDYKDMVRRRYDVDLESASDLTEGNDVRSYMAEEIAAQWRNLSVDSDASRAWTLDETEILTVLENATYGGVPIIAIRVPLKELLKTDLDQPIEISGVSDRKEFGGMIGVHDFVNGSGYVDNFKGKTFITEGKRGNWILPEKTGYGFDKAYGFVLSYLDANIKPGMAPEQDAIPGLSL